MRATQVERVSARAQRTEVGELDKTPLTPQVSPDALVRRRGLGSMPTPHVSFSPTSLGASAPVSFASRRLPGVSGELERLVTAARAGRASDMHLVAGEPLRVRIAGALVKSPTHPDRVEPDTVERIVFEHVPERLRARLETEGSCDFALADDRTGRMRVNVCRHRTGYKACFRLVARALPTIASLGLPPSIAEATRHHQGLIVVTGPTGHGKTSTLAALVDRINETPDGARHIITVEDPIEIMHPRKRALMSQREVGTHTRSFASALRAALREDPDVIVVGELRDVETVRMALAASETGHLVLGTMNSPSAAKTVDRIIDLFPPADQGQARMTLSIGLRLVVGQRLVPTTDGGLAAAVELLPGSIALSNLVREGKTFQIPSLQQRGRALGIVRLDESLVELVRARRVEVDVARAFAESPDALRAAGLG
jgi:twitching motility protein PilT